MNDSGAAGGASATPDAPGVPWYVQALDALVVGALAVSASTLVFGRLLVRFDTVRISVQSPLRALAITAALLLIRHVIWRRPSLPGRIVAACRRWRTDPAVLAAARAMVSIRLPIIVAACFAVLILKYPGEKPPPFRVSDNEFVNLPARWDAGWYLSIAVDGYSRAGRADAQQNIAFFPAYPMLMRIGGMLVGARASQEDRDNADYADLVHRATERTLVAGWLIALGATALALVYLYRLARDTFGDHAAAGSVLLISAYPFAYFFGAAYTEGLFLLGTVATVYHFRRGEYGPAAAWGLLVGLTRPNGCFLSVPLGIMALQMAFLPRTLRAGDPAPRPGLRGFLPAIVTAAMPGIGMVAFSAWLWTFTGQPLAWMQAHKGWGRTFQSVGGLLSDRIETLEVLGAYQYSAEQPIEVLYVAAVALCLATVWPIARRLGLGYAVLVLITIVPPLSAGGFLSMGRITSTLFPVFLYLGWRLSPARQGQFATAGMALQGMLAALFFTWRQVF